MEIHETSAGHFRHVVVWALIAGTAVIIAFSLIARAKLNLQGALTDKPDIAVLLLLEKDGIAAEDSELLRDLGQERDYVVQTGSGSLFVKLRQTGGEWRIAEKTRLHAS